MATANQTLIANQTFTKDTTTASAQLAPTATAIRGTVAVTALSQNTTVEVDGQLSFDGGATWQTEFAMAVGRGTNTFGGSTGQLLVEGDLGGALVRGVVGFGGTNPKPSATLSVNLAVTS